MPDTGKTSWRIIYIYLRVVANLRGDVGNVVYTGNARFVNTRCYRRDYIVCVIFRFFIEKCKK